MLYFVVSRQASVASDNSGVVFTAPSFSQDDTVSEKSLSSNTGTLKTSKQTSQESAGIRMILVWCERVEDKDTIPWSKSCLTCYDNNDDGSWLLVACNNSDGSITKPYHRRAICCGNSSTNQIPKLLIYEYQQVLIKMENELCIGNFSCLRIPWDDISEGQSRREVSWVPTRED